jgi:hypothetical protein
MSFGFQNSSFKSVKIILRKNVAVFVTFPRGPHIKILKILDAPCARGACAKALVGCGPSAEGLVDNFQGFSMPRLTWSCLGGLFWVSQGGQSVMTSSIADPCPTTSAPTAVLTCLWGQVQYERRRRQLLKLVTLMARLAWAPGISALFGVSAPLLFLELAGHKQRLTAKHLALLTCQIHTAKVLRNISDKALVALRLQFHGVLDGNAERWNRWKRLVASHVLAALARSKARQFAWVKLNKGGCCCPSYRPRGMTQKLCHSLGLHFAPSGGKTIHYI